MYKTFSHLRSKEFISMYTSGITYSRYNINIYQCTFRVARESDAHQTSTAILSKSKFFDMFIIATWFFIYYCLNLKIMGFSFTLS